MNQTLIEKYGLHRPEYETLLTQYVQSIAALFDVPVAFLGISDNDTLWIKAGVGTNVEQVPLHDAICNLVFETNDLVYIPDTTQDPRTSKKPAVIADHGVRFYAGVPFSIQSHTIGSFCVIDSVSRTMSEKELKLLTGFARHVGQQVELIYKNIRTEDEHQLLNNSPAALIRWQLRPNFQTSYLSANMSKLLGITIPQDVSLFKLDSVIHPDDTDNFLFTVRNHQQGAEICECDFRIKVSGNRATWYKLVSRAIFEGKTVIAIQGLLLNNTEQKYLESRIMDTNERMRLLLEASGLGTSDWDIENDSLRVNNRICDILKLHPDSVDTQSMFWMQLVHPADKEKLVSQIEHSLKSKNAVVDIEYRLRDAEGQYLWVETYGKVVTRDEDGRALRFAATHRNITEKKLAELHAEKQRRLFGFINHAQNLFVAQKDLQLACEQIFPELMELAESAYGFIGKMECENGVPCLQIYAISDVSWSESSKAEYNKFKQGELRFTNLNNLFGHVVTSNSPVMANKPMMHKASKGTPSGHPVLKRFLGLPIQRDGRVVGMIGLANKLEDYTQQDVEFLTPLTETLANLFKAVEVEQARFEAEERLAYLAATDPLTGLMNRRAYFDQIQQRAAVSNAPHGLAIVDIDNFKLLNDGYGHPVGDKVLKEVADVLRRNIRNNDMVARLGGEEFGIYLDTEDSEVCQKILQTMLEQIKQITLNTEQGPLNHITVSIGATMFRKSPQAIDTTYFDIAMKQADDALYDVKRSGKANIAWYGAPVEALNKPSLSEVKH
ncbi:diguanylate cyclase [Alteromonas sp. AMM-1]|uniref:sensor domain-containing diguanylate cyclase n=1 Tax=Alteromonas sp. AMM-1 TaxID=3394233 RepID=UPI0039A4F934